MSIDVLKHDQAVMLLGRIAGDRVDEDRDIASELASRCGYLPLALRVAGAKLASKPHWTLARVLALLDGTRDRLDELTFEHLDVRASIGLSYEALTNAAQCLLRRLGDVELAEASVWASASLLDVSADAAEEILEELFDAQLIEVAGTDITGHVRFRMHDLTRLYASERAAADEDPSERDAASARLLGAWLVMITAAYRAVHAGDYQNIRGDSQRWEPDARIVAELAAKPLQWVEAERHAIVAMVSHAARVGHTTACWELTTTVSPLLQLRRLYDEWKAILETAHTATLTSEDRRGHAAILYRMGFLHADRQDYVGAWNLLQGAAELFREAHDRHGWANATAFAAMSARVRGDDQTALRLYREALPSLRESQDRGGQAFVLRSIGQIQTRKRQYEAANTSFGQALSIYHAIGSASGQAQVGFWHGMLYLEQDNYSAARDAFGAALEICRRVGDRPGEAQSLRGLAAWHRRQGHREAAMAALNEALRVVQQPRPTMLEITIREEIDAL